MTQGPASLAGIAASVGNPARANILLALLDGRALTAKELAFAAGVSPQTTSEHLAQLLAAGLTAVTRQGRHAYYRIASPNVARMMESIMAVSADQAERTPLHWRGGEALRQARTCYDHLAGRLGVALCDALVEQGHVVLGDDGGEVTPAGTAFLSDLGMTLQGRRCFCRPCLDWSERRTHLGGAVGAAICRYCFDHGWIARMSGSRAVRITPDGAARLPQTFGMTLDVCQG